MRTYVLALICALAIGGCSMRGSGGEPASTGYLPLIEPQVVQAGGGAAWVKFAPHTLGALGSGIVAGPDGNMWYIDENASQLVRLSMSGSFKEFSMAGKLGGNALALTVGADNKFYIANESATIVRVSTAGTVKAFTIPSGDSTLLGTIARGPDGNVWFPESAHLGMITPSGAISEFAYPAGFGLPNQFGTITTGADNNVWFNEGGDNSIVKFTIATHAFKEYKTVALTACSPAGLVKAADNNIWFTCTSRPPRVGRITTGGAVKLFPGGGATGTSTYQIATLGPDGEPWYARSDNGTIFRINTAHGSVSSFSPPFVGEQPDSVAAGPDGNIWVTTVGLGHVYIYVLNPLRLSPRKLSFSGLGQSLDVTVAEGGAASWTATSTNSAVATVMQGSPADTFVVTSVAPGSCKVRIADAVGNSASVTVTVP